MAPTSSSARVRVASTMRMLSIERSDLGLAFVYAVAIGVLSLISAIAVQALVNTLAFTNAAQPLVVLTLAVLVALAFVAIFQTLQSVAIERMQRRIFVRTALQFAGALAPMRRRRRNEIEPLQFLEVITLQKAISALLLGGLSVALQLLLGAILTALYHPYFLVFNLVLAGTLALLLVAAGRGALKSASRECATKYEVARWLDAVSLESNAFRSREGLAFASATVRSLAASHLHERAKHFRVLLLQSCIGRGVQTLATAGLLGIGGFLVMRGKITLGQLVAAELVMAAVLAGVSSIGKHLENIYDLIVAADKLAHLVDLPHEESGHHLLPRKATGMSVRLYRTASPSMTTEEISIEHNERVAILNDDSTALIEALHLSAGASEWRCDLDGVDVRELDASSTRDQIAIARADEVWPGTVFDNVSVGRSNVDVPKARLALERVGLWNHIAMLPDGIATRLEHRDELLTAAQKRRLFLARAIAGQPRLLVIDKLFDELPIGSRAGLFESVLSIQTGATVVVATNDRSIAEMCSRILPQGLTMEHGSRVRS